MNHFPAIDVLMSISRLMSEVASPKHKEVARKLRDLMATYYNAKDLIDVGAYKSGTNTKIDESIKKIDRINDFLMQGVTETNDFDTTVQKLLEIAK